MDRNGPVYAGIYRKEGSTPGRNDSDHFNGRPGRPGGGSRLHFQMTKNNGGARRAAGPTLRRRSGRKRDFQDQCDISDYISQHICKGTDYSGGTHQGSEAVAELEMAKMRPGRLLLPRKMIRLSAAFLIAAASKHCSRRPVS